MDDLDALLVDPMFPRDPYPVYARLRDQGPLYWSDRLGYWFVTHFRELKAVLRDHERFSNAGWDEIFLSELPAEIRGRLTALSAHFARPTLVSADPPVHTRLRRLVNRTFTPRATEILRPRVEQAVRQLLDDLPDRRSFDVVKGLAQPLPVLVFADIFGIPRQDCGSLKQWSEDFTAFVSNVRPDAGAADKANTSLEAFRAYLREIVVSRRRSPRHDLVDVLLAPDANGDALTEAEFLSVAAHLLIAGHETTSNLIANGLLGLLSHPEQLEALRREPALASAVVEETFRWESPLQRVKRKAIVDAELGGRIIRAGDRIMLLIGAANRDPRTFDDPDVFVVDRQDDESHLALGQGIHFCVGAGLARLEAPIVLNALLERYDRLALADDWTPDWNPSLLRGLQSLRVVVE